MIFMQLYLILTSTEAMRIPFYDWVDKPCSYKGMLLIDKIRSGQEYGLTPVISALWRQRQRDHKFEASLGYMVIPDSNKGTKRIRFLIIKYNVSWNCFLDFFQIFWESFKITKEFLKYFMYIVYSHNSLDYQCDVLH